MLVALIVGELTNNSLKYGALLEGRSVSLTAAMEGDSIVIRWNEETKASAATALTPRDTGSGYAMMERMARAQGADFEHSLNRGRLHVLLRVKQGAQ